MGAESLPATYRFTCDGCGTVEERASSSRPKHWCDFHILRDAYDFQDCAVADGSVKRLLCPECAGSAAKAVNEAIGARHAELAKARGEVPAEQEASR